jgi:hypothetical protein
MADERARKRTALLAPTEAELDKIARQITAGRLTDPGKIGVRAGNAADHYKMAKHFQLHIDHGEFTYTRDETSIAAEAALDGIYVIRNSVKNDRLDASGVMEAYKDLANVEADMRSIKTVDLNLRPVYHRLQQRVAAHVFLCMLARYLTWHLRQAASGCASPTLTPRSTRSPNPHPPNGAPSSCSTPSCRAPSPARRQNPPNPLPHKPHVGPNPRRAKT